ncbi:hypothetical protein LK540_20440 [Massilia sp. IC2-278]|uniref:hypothetical protein n=1 Tax=Massilia sp. IC2-278 TaxID=2887200 RepID=UPI001E374A1F|nr:hypothetical protein [Massilia sp. IC2-278]MCC2962805.1 hypothetical protein [Massilia sp. IC2-278]
MARDPLRDAVDAPLFIVPRVLERLRSFRPALDGEALAEFERLRGRLLEGIEGHPTRFWVLKHVQKAVEAVAGEDLETRKRFGVALKELLVIVGTDDVGVIL